MVSEGKYITVFLLGPVQEQVRNKFVILIGFPSQLKSARLRTSELKQRRMKIYQRCAEQSYDLITAKKGVEKCKKKKRSLSELNQSFCAVFLMLFLTTLANKLCNISAAFDVSQVEVSWRFLVSRTQKKKFSERIFFATKCFVENFLPTMKRSFCTNLSNQEE